MKFYLFLFVLVHVYVWAFDLSIFFCGFNTIGFVCSFDFCDIFLHAICFFQATFFRGFRSVVILFF